MKFDICLMNPPYGSVGGDTIHLKFVDKCLDFASTQVVVMPFKFVTKIYHKPAKKFKEKFSPYLSEVEEVDSKCFIGTEMYNVGIYVFGDETQNIDIKYVNSQNETLPSLLDKSEFTVYEKEIIQYLEKQGSQEIIWAGGNRKLKSELQNIAVENHKDFLKKKIIDSCKNLKQQNIINQILDNYPNVYVISLKGPMDKEVLHNLKNYMCLYEYTPNSIRTIIKFFKKELSPLGHLPLGYN